MKELPRLNASVFGALAMAALVAAPAAAQVEITPFVGYSLSEGVEVDRAADVGDNFLTGVNAPSGLAFGLGIDFWVDGNIQLGVLASSQSSSLELEGNIDGSSTFDLADLRINTYHGTATFHGGSRNSKTRPFFMFGLGASQLNPGETEGGQTVGSEWEFSGTLGGGVKTYINDKVGFKFSGRWTPTYIKSDPGGMYCSPYWNPYWGPSCVVLADTDYLNQVEFTAGIIVRF